MILIFNNIYPFMQCVALKSIESFRQFGLFLNQIGQPPLGLFALIAVRPALPRGRIDPARLENSGRKMIRSSDSSHLLTSLRLFGIANSNLQHYAIYSTYYGLLSTTGIDWVTLSNKGCIGRNDLNMDLTQTKFHQFPPNVSVRWSLKRCILQELFLTPIPIS